MTTKVQRMVSKSAKLLDKKIPGWAKQIKLKSFNIDSNENCILGQLGNGDPYGPLDTLGIDAEDTIKWGFEMFSSYKPLIKELNEAWKTVIRLRKIKPS